MDESTRQPIDPQLARALGNDGISVRRWFAVYLVLLLGLGGALAYLLQRDPIPCDSWESFKSSVALAGPGVKLLVFGIYLMISCTFIPLNTSWIVAAVAMEEYAVADELWATVVVVAVVGAMASTVANLNDYHVFTLLLRSERISRVRDTRIYRVAARWFDRAPFAITFIFNLLPIPFDVARMMAATHRYPRLPFAAANFTGRLFRYAIIAYVTYRLADKGWIAAVTLLTLALVLGVGRIVMSLAERRTPRSAPERAGQKTQGDCT